MLKAKAIGGLCASAGLASLLIIGGGGAANAAQAPVIDTAQAAELRATWTDNGVSSADQDSLLAKLSSGEALDSQTGEAPTSSSVADEAGWRTTTDRFADGSYVIRSQELPTAAAAAPGGAHVRAVTGCRNSTSASYQIRTGCTVKWSDAISYMSWEMNFRFIAGGHGSGQIDKVYSFAADIASGTYSNQKVSIVKKTGTSADPAIASGGYNYNLSSGGGSVSASVYVDQSGALQGAYSRR